MITIMDEANVRSNPNLAQTVKTYVCLSSDTKPTEQVENGSTLLEMDTGKVYVFDRENSTWIKL